MFDNFSLFYAFYMEEPHIPTSTRKHNFNYLPQMMVETFDFPTHRNSFPLNEIVKRDHFAQ